MKSKSTATKRKLLIKAADLIFSMYIRSKGQKENGGKCAFCGKPLSCCFHFFSRVNYATRWDEDNATYACHGCNMRMEFAPYPFYQWYKEKYGQEKLDALSRKHNQISKLDCADLQAIVDHYKKKLEGIG